jgi:hypothetical protein
MKRETLLELGVFLLLVALGVLTRWVTGEFKDLSNFTATGAAALFAGFYFRNRLAAPLVPLTIMVVSNFALQPYDSRIQVIVVYLAWIVPVILGFALRGQANAWRVGGCAVVSAVSFFVITNFAGWACYDLYPKTFSGVIESYLAGTPFFKNTLASELLFSGLIFGTYAVAVQMGLLPNRIDRTSIASGS